MFGIRFNMEACVCVCKTASEPVREREREREKIKERKEEDRLERPSRSILTPARREWRKTENQSRALAVENRSLGSSVFVYTGAALSPGNTRSAVLAVDRKIVDAKIRTLYLSNDSSSHLTIVDTLFCRKNSCPPPPPSIPLILVVLCRDFTCFHFLYLARCNTPGEALTPAKEQERERNW